MGREVSIKTEAKNVVDYLNLLLIHCYQLTSIIYQEGYTFFGVPFCSCFLLTCRSPSYSSVTQNSEESCWTSLLKNCLAICWQVVSNCTLSHLFCIVQILLFLLSLLLLLLSLCFLSCKVSLCQPMKFTNNISKVAHLLLKAIDTSLVFTSPQKIQYLL